MSLPAFNNLAWEIRRSLAKRYNVPVMSISWKMCLENARHLEESRELWIIQQKRARRWYFGTLVFCTICSAICAGTMFSIWL